MKSEKEIFTLCLKEFRALIMRTGQEFLKKNDIPIPGGMDSTELRFYTEGGLHTLNMMDRTLDIAFGLLEYVDEA